jgi:hypothetical protein
LVKGRRVAAVRAAEQQQIGRCLEIVLDPMARLSSQRPLELRAHRGMRMRRRLAADDPRKQERDTDRRRDQC